MKKWLVWGLIVVLSLSMLGCAAKQRTTNAQEHYAPAVPDVGGRTSGSNMPYDEQALWESDKAADISILPATVGRDEHDTGMPGVDPAAAPDNVDRMIIYSVYLHLIVQDTQDTFDQIRQLTEGIGGFVANSNTWKDGERLRGTMTVRVPADSLQEALSQFKGLALDIESQRMDSQDVTEEYVDLEARLGNLKRTEEELLELLSTRSATGKTSDILEVQREVTAVRAQIEQIQGRIKYLSNLSAMATINITLTPDELLQPVVVAGWRPEGTAREALRALIRTLQFIADLIIVFVLYILPVIIIIAIPVAIAVLIIRAWWKRRKQRRQAQKAAAIQAAE